MKTRRLRMLLALVTVGAAFAASGPAPSTTASAAPSVDPYASPTYQHDAVHDGNSVDSSFVAPLTLAWSKDLGGSVGYPVIADNRMFVLFANASGTGDDIEALDVASGAVLWGPTQLVGNGYGSVTYDAGQIFTMNVSGQVTAFDAATGTQSWTTQLALQFSFRSPLTATGGRLYAVGAGTGGTLYSIDESNGSTVWTGSLNGGEVDAPIADGSNVYVSIGCEHAYKFDLNGTLVWHYPGYCSGGSGSTPVLHGGRLYLHEGAPATNPPTILDAGTGTKVGTYATDVPPAFDGDLMATVSSGVLSVSDVVTGKVIWKSSNSNNSTAPLMVNGYLVEARSNGELDVRHAQNGALAWQYSTGTPFTTSGPLPALAQGDGALAFPVGTKLFVFVPAGDTKVTMTGGPPSGSVVSASSTITYAFSSAVPNARYQCTLDGDTSPCTSPLTLHGDNEGVHTLSVSVAYATRGAATRTFTIDWDAPLVRLRPFKPVMTGRLRAVAHWGATDDRSGVKAYQLRFHRARIGGSFSGWKLLATTTAHRKRLWIGGHGWELCASVRARDGAGTWSAWSPPQCVAHP